MAFENMRVNEITQGENIEYRKKKSPTPSSEKPQHLKAKNCSVKKLGFSTFEKQLL